MLIDAHLHCTGRETQADVLRTLDAAGIDVGVLLAPFLLADGRSFGDARAQREGNAHLARLVRGASDRLVGLAFIDPSRRDAVATLDRAIDSGLRGAKMVPSGWFAHDDAVQPVFARAAALGLPVLLHSGIFIDGRSSRFCRPVDCEALRQHRGMRPALAHLGWPWTDEAIALGLIDRIHGVADDAAAFRFDLSFGAPPPYRLAVLDNALQVLGAGLLQFGSDCFLPCDGAHINERRGWLIDLLDRLEVAADARERIFAGTAAAWLGPALPRPGALASAGSAATPDATHAAPKPAAAASARLAAKLSDAPLAGLQSGTATAGPVALRFGYHGLRLGRRRWARLCC